MGKCDSWLPTIIFLSLVVTVSAQARDPVHCFVVSGMKSELKSSGFIIPQTGLSEAPRALKELKRKGIKCQIFSSWQEVEAEVFPHGKPKYSESTPILILQQAHGLPERAYCDAGPISQGDIVETLNRIASRHSVGAIFDTCFSGETLRTKLITDDLSKNPQALENLCMVTGSQFGRAQHGGMDLLSLSLLKLFPGNNLEDLIRIRGDGLISSAAWDSSGLTEYFRGQQLEQGLRALARVGEIGGRCAVPEKALSANYCASPSAWMGKAEGLLNWVPTQLSRHFSSFGVGIAPQAKPIVVPLLVLKNWQKSLRERTDQENARIESIRDGKIRLAPAEFQKLRRSAYDRFQFEQLLSDFLNEQDKDPSAQSVQAFISKYWNYVEVPMEIERSLVEYQKSLLLDPEAEKKLKIELLKSICGSEVLQEEMAFGLPVSWTQVPSTSAALQGFVEASLDELALPSEVDQKRRKACRSFVLFPETPALRR